MTEAPTEQAIVVLVTAPDEHVGARIAHALLAAHAAACVNIVGHVRSLYRWEGAVQDDREVQLLIKTRHGRLEDVKKVVRDNHPYDVPELIALPVLDGSAAYLAWILSETNTQA